MPTNLKSLLSRSRSRSELKSNKEDNECSSNETKDNGNEAYGGNGRDGIMNEGTSTSCTNDNHKVSNDSCYRIPSNEPTTCGKQYTSCSMLNHQDLSSSHHRITDNTFSGDAASPSGSEVLYNKSTNAGNFRYQIGFVGSGKSCSGGSTSAHHHQIGQGPSSHQSQSHLNVQQQSPHQQQNLTMRKCETVLALSNFSRDSSCSTATSPTDSVASGTSGKVRVVKDKILSTSSSTLNCLLHSSASRSKLFSSWKLSSNNSTSNQFPSSTFPDFYSRDETENNRGSACGSSRCHHNGANCGTADASPQISKSQQHLLIPGNNFGPIPLTPTNRLRRNISVNNACFSLSPNSSYSRSSSVASFGWKEDQPVSEEVLCRLCLCNVKLDDTVEILGCSCRYCKDCIVAYVSFEIQEGAEDIACPDASCEGQGVLTLPEIEVLLPPSLIEKHKKFRMYREVEKDGHLMWCPTPGCESVCRIQENVASFEEKTPGSKPRSSSANKSLIINCTTCQKSFCAECKLSWHPGTSCESFRRKLIKQGKLSLEDEELFSLDSIKKCPFCHVPIEKDSGCAQMMCKRCKHVFCWYCLASLDDDFLLRHYDKGPCKNKLGHSRASVVWHRAQVIGIFAGFGVLVLLASPLLILAAPCLLCCRCRYCANKDPEESPVAV